MMVVEVEVEVYVDGKLYDLRSFDNLDSAFHFAGKNICQFSKQGCICKIWSYDELDMQDGKAGLLIVIDSKEVNNV